MRTAWQTFPIEYKGGLITNLAPLQHGVSAPGSAIALQNFEPSIEGGYKKVLGYQKWNEFVVPGTGLVTGVISTDVRDAIAVRNSKYYTSEDKANWVERLDLSATAGNKIRHTVFNYDGTTKVCMVDGVNKPVFWDSSDQSIVEDTSAPSDVQGATRVMNFKNHLFFAKGSDLIFTSPFNELDYNPANGAGTINVGARIVGLIVFREQLIVFSLDRIQRIVGNTAEDFALQPIAMNTGTFCGDTVQEVGGDVLYLGPDGVRYLSATERIGDFALERASEAIQNKLVNFFAECENYSSVVIRKKSQYRIFRYESTLASRLAGGFLGTRFLDRESSGIAWAETLGFKVYNSDSKLFRDQEVVIFSNETDYVYAMENGNSLDGANIEALFQTPFIPIEDSRVRKTYYKHTLYVKSEGDFDIAFNMLFDYEGVGVLQPSVISLKADQSSVTFWGSPTAIWGQFNWTNNPRQVYNNNVLGSSFTVSLRFYDNSTNPSFSVDTSTLEFKFNDRK
jgi:hypothetical protein